MSRNLKLSPFMALSLLSSWEKGLVQLTQEAYDEAFDTLTDALGTFNDNQYRLVSVPTEESDVK